MWVSTQRQFKKKGKLDPERRKILEEIGFQWGVTLATWEETVFSYQQSKKREGHCNVPRSHEEDGIKLGTWVNSQRRNKGKGKLHPKRQKILEEIGFEWGGISASRDGIYSRLKQFKRHHTEDGTKLSTWVNTKRQCKRMGKLDPDRQNTLDKIGFKRAVG